MRFRTELMRVPLLFVMASALALPAAAAETKTYTYDALGRLVKVDNSGTVNNDKTRSFCYDKAGNRVEFNSNDTATAATCVTQG